MVSGLRVLANSSLKRVTVLLLPERCVCLDKGAQGVVVTKTGNHESEAPGRMTVRVALASWALDRHSYMLCSFVSPAVAHKGGPCNCKSGK